MFEEIKKEIIKKEKSKKAKQVKQEDQELVDLMNKILSDPQHFLREDMMKWLKRKLRNLEKAKEDLKKMEDN